MAASVDETFRLALAALQSGKVQDAEQRLREVLRGQPRHVPSLNVLSILLTRTGRLTEAESVVQQAINQGGALDATFYNYGLILQALKRPAAALEQFNKALALNSAVAETWNNRGVIFNELGKYREAIADFDKALSIKRDAAAYCNKAKALAKLRQYDASLANYDHALALNPTFAEAWVGRGHVLSGLDNYADALTAYRRAAELRPNLAEGWAGHGEALDALGQASEALAAYDRAVAINPSLSAAWLGRGAICARLGRADEARDAFDRAVRSGDSNAWLGRGDILFNLGRIGEAGAAYEQALVIAPDLPGGWVGRGNVAALSEDHVGALTAYERALALDPELTSAWFGQACVFITLKKHGEAFAAFDRAFKIDPNYRYLEGHRLYVKMQLCDWVGIEREIEHLLESLRQGRKSSTPFAILPISNSPVAQLACAKSYIADQPSFRAPRTNTHSHLRMHVAYLSADFRDHPVARLMAGVFECHDKARIQTVAISLGAASDAAVAKRIRSSADKFIDVGMRTDAEIAQLMREMEIDIAVDLMGFTQGNRLNVLAMRPAPIQINYLGLPATMGAPYVDYIIADRTAIPEDSRRHYAEKIVYMPDTFQANEGKHRVAGKIFTRADVGLPAAGFVFGCFNGNYKITPEVFDSWMRILQRVDGAVLWLYAENPVAADNLRREAEKRGVVTERLIFAPAMQFGDHQARLALADLLLDTAPYNGGASASDGLWAGVPVLTRIGETFTGRMAASLLKTVGLADLITSSAAKYEALAIELASDDTKIAAIKDKLNSNRLTTPLFDSARFTRHLESAYNAMYERHLRGEPPAHFAVGPVPD